MKKLFTHPFLYTLFGFYFLLASPSLLCMHRKQPSYFSAKKLAECLVITQKHLNKQLFLKPKQPQLTSAHNSPKKYKNREILAPLCIKSIETTSGSRSSETLSSSINSDEIHADTVSFDPISPPANFRSTSSSRKNYVETYAPIIVPTPIKYKQVPLLDLSE